jgi:hypothetical protein
VPCNHLQGRQGARGERLFKEIISIGELSKIEEFGVSKIDTLWTLRIRTNGTFKEFKTGLTAVLEHHFDNHKHHCGDWCKAKGKEGEEKKSTV